jgi:hypothetical protein
MHLRQSFQRNSGVVSKRRERDSLSGEEIKGLSGASGSSSTKAYACFRSAHKTTRDLDGFHVAMNQRCIQEIADTHGQRQYPNG